MAIQSSDLSLNNYLGTVLKTGAKNNAFSDGRVGDGDVYAYLEIRNNHASLSFSSGKLWCYSDPRGGTFALALVDGLAYTNSAAWPWSTFTPSGLTYSTPTTQSAGLTLPTLAAGQKVLFVARRNLASASTAYPERNVIYVGGTSPI